MVKQKDKSTGDPFLDRLLTHARKHAWQERIRVLRIVIIGLAIVAISYWLVREFAPSLGDDILASLGILVLVVLAGASLQEEWFGNFFYWVLAALAGTAAAVVRLQWGTTAGSVAFGLVALAVLPTSDDGADHQRCIRLLKPQLLVTSIQRRPTEGCA